ncbi:MAG: DNA repair protein RecO [Bacillota bacterium]
MPEILKTQAIVLRSRNYSEADQLLTLFTEKSGKLNAIVKGVKKPASKLRGGVQVFSLTNIALYLGKNLATVTQAEVINSFFPLREDLLRMSCAAYISELVDALVPEEERDETLYNLLLVGLHILSLEEPWLAARVLEIRITSALGYQLQFDNCVCCGQNIKVNTFLSVAQGGQVCEQCLKTYHNPEVIKISGETSVLFRKLMEIETSMLNRLRISQTAKKEIEEILDIHITNCIGRKLKSKEFLNSLA